MSPKVTLKQVRAFVTVAQQGSFTRASERLALSQPALTTVIRQLEQTIGINLFDRTTRRVSLTSEGSDFLPTAERLLTDFDLAITDIRAIAERRRGRVSIAALFSVATMILPGAVREFAGSYPAISIHLRDDNSAGVRRRVRLNEVDFGFAGREDDDPELEYVRVFRDPLILVGRSDHPLMRLRRELCWKDLEGHDFLGLGKDTGIRPVVESVPGIAANVASPRYETSNTPTLEALIEEGLGVTALPSLAAPRMKSGRLRSRPIGDPVVMREVFLITRKGRSLSPAAQSMKALVLSHIRDYGRASRLIECTL